MLTYAMWIINYYNNRVQHDLESWPVGIYADFLRLIKLMESNGADLRLPHARGRKGLVALFIARWSERRL
jgi:hypothetical protein